MAVQAISDASLAEFASTLKQEDVPVKLRCQICHNIAFNAWRLPCCAGDVCEPCHDTVPDDCPICLHSPVPKEDFKPNKKLRNTVKAFLKGKATEQANKRKKEEAAAQATAAATPVVEALASPTVPVTPHAPVESVYDVTTTEDAGSAAPPDSAADTQATEQADRDAAPNQHSIEGNMESIQTAADGQMEEQCAEQVGGGYNGATSGKENQNMTDAMMNGTMPFAGMNGAFPMDPSQMMNMSMMGIDPMTMLQQMQAQMYGGYGGGMNMNGGMDYNSNQYGGYNGQQNGWGGQDNYNANYGGYNSGNYNHINQQQYGRNDFQFGYRGRGRGRGRGGWYGRGGYYNNQNYRGNNDGGYANNSSYQDYNQGQGQYHAQHAERPQSKSFASEGASARENENTQVVNEFQPGGTESSIGAEGAAKQVDQPMEDTHAQNGNDEIHADVTSQRGNEVAEVSQPANTNAQADDGQPMAIQTFVSDDPRGRYGPKIFAGSTNPPVSNEPRGVPGAPTGPRALREGLPNTGAVSRGFSIAGRASSNMNIRTKPADADAGSRHEDEMHSVHTKAISPARERSRTRSRTRSRSPYRSSRHKNRRDRSRSLESYDYESEKRDRRNEKRRRRSHKHEDEHSEDDSAHRSSHRSHRHRHRDKDRKDKEKDRERDRSDRDYERSSHRHRDEDKDRDRSDESNGSRKRRHREREEDNGYDRHERKRSRREREASYEPESRSSRHGNDKRRDSKPATPITPSAPAFPISDSASRRASLAAIAERRHRPQSSSGAAAPPINAPSGPSKSIPTGPRNRESGVGKRDRHRRRDRESTSRYEDDVVPPVDGGASTALRETKDPHTLEREARDRERMEKERQRREKAGEVSGGGSRSEKKVSRTLSYKYEDDEEERRKEIEREREDARWV